MSTDSPAHREPLAAGAEPGETPLTAARDPGHSPSYRRVLSNRPFFGLWTAQLVSQSGDYIFEVALLWLVLKLTGSPFAVALIVTGFIIPGVVLGPFLGVYVDRWDRRRTLIATNVVQGLVVTALSGLVVAGREDLSVLFAIALMLGSGTTLVRNATNAYRTLGRPGRRSASGQRPPLPERLDESDRGPLSRRRLRRPPGGRPPDRVPTRSPSSLPR